MATKKNVGEKKPTGKKKGRLKNLPRKKAGVTPAEADAVKGGKWVKMVLTARKAGKDQQEF